jgi:hypothetical protein
MPYISNVVDRALAVLASQFSESKANGDLNNFQKFIKAFALSIQELEDTNYQLLNERNIYTAVGVQLDGLGQILGLARADGESDEDYRENLKFQIFINEGTGTPEEVIAVLKFLTNANRVRYNEYYPAAFQMSTDGLTFPDPPEELVEAIQEASPAAVQYTPITATYGVDVPFVFGLDSEIELLWVTDPANPGELENLQLDTTDLLYVNRSVSTTNTEGGGFAEYVSPDIDTTGAGQLAEVIYYNGSVAPAP